MKENNIYIVAKPFNQQGSFVYKCKTVSEARFLPSALEIIRAEGVQIVMLNDLEIYAEYAPYEHIEDVKIFTEIVNKMKTKIEA